MHPVMNRLTGNERPSDREEVQRAIEGLQNAQYPEETRYYLNILRNLKLSPEEQKRVEQIIKKKMG
jgi:hypothetical protein